MHTRERPAVLRAYLARHSGPTPGGLRRPEVLLGTRQGLTRCALALAQEREPTELITTARLILIPKDRRRKSWTILLPSHTAVQGLSSTVKD